MSTHKVRSSLAGSTASLISGSVLASLLTFAALPFIARLYDPSAMGVGVVFLSLHTFLSVIVTGRYPLAIPLPKHKETARYLFWLVILLSLTLGLMIAMVGFVLRWRIAIGLSAPELAPWLPFLGVTVAAAALSEAINYMLIRHKHFKVKAMLGVGQAILTVGSILGFGLIFNATITTYMAAQIIGICLASLTAAAICYPTIRGKLRWTRMLKIASCFRHLPKHLLTTSVLNTGSLTALPIMISAFSGPATAAAYAIANQLVSKPLGLISSAIWQVVYGRLGNATNNLSQAKRLLSRIYMATSLLYSVPIIVIVAFPDLPTILLGNKWKDVGPMMQVVILMAYFQYASNSISYFQSFGKYTHESVANIGLVILRFGSLIAAASLGLNGFYTVELFCIASATIYIAITTYWSQVLGLTYKLPLRGILILLVTYSVSWSSANLFNNLVAHIVLIGILLTAIIYAICRQISNVGTNVKPQSKT
jgi:O-antigen/teichoic acid export membrane protein